MGALYRKMPLLLLPLLLIPLLPALGFGADGIYLGGTSGYRTVFDSDVNDAGSYLVAELHGGTYLGGTFGCSSGTMRLEGEFSWQKNDFDRLTDNTQRGTAASTVSDMSGDIAMLSLWLNGYYDFSIAARLKPFVGIGLGCGRFEIDSSGFVEDLVKLEEDDLAFVHQVILGIAYAISDTVTVDARYRFYGTDDPQFDGTGITFRGHGFEVGMRIGF